MTTKALMSRLKAAEAPIERHEGELPEVLPDDAPQADLDRLRANGKEAYRFSEFVDHAV